MHARIAEDRIRLVVVANGGLETGCDAIADIQSVGVKGPASVVTVQLIVLSANRNQGIGVEVPAVGNSFQSSGHLLEEDGLRVG